jgi:SMI1/KNR4 family protein SUKH-1
MAASAFAAKLEMLEVHPTTGRVEPSLRLVQDYEREFGLALPADYREFLAAYGSVSLSARYPFAEPTPFGQTGMIDDFFGFVPGPAGSRTDQFRGHPLDRHGVYWNTWLIEGAPDVVAIGSDLMGGMTWLKCTGEDAGSVYFHDGYQRWLWSDAEFYGHFPNLHPDIRRYLELRGAGLLPKKKRGYHNVYLIARSFSEFIDLLRPPADN